MSPPYGLRDDANPASSAVLNLNPIPEDLRPLTIIICKLCTGEALGFVLSTFALVFAAEWGDKSFLATIALAAASSPAGVVLGAVGGHGVATGIAVLGGSYLSRYVSEKAVQYLGGTLFLVFAAATIFDIVVK